MKLPALLFFASAISDANRHGAIGVLLYATLVPAFAYGALRGVHLLLGVFQMIVLCSAEFTQWRLTRQSGWATKLISAVSTYLAANLLFSLSVFGSTYLLIEHTHVK